MGHFVSLSTDVELPKEGHSRNCYAAIPEAQTATILLHSETAGRAERQGDGKQTFGVIDSVFNLDPV